MTEDQRKARNSEKLGELYPSFRVKVAAVIRDLQGHGFRPRIQDAYRSPQAQAAAFHSGHSKLLYGFHNVTGAHGQPESLAVDLLDDDHPAQESSRYLLILAASAQAHGLATGIRWGLPQGLRSAIDRAIEQRGWSAPVKVGWDPAHVETTGVTVAQAKDGKRPL